MMLDIPDNIARRLQALAERNDRRVEDVLSEILDQIESKACTDETQWATLADLARHAKLMNMASPHAVNIDESSRDILNTEFADYLQERIDR